MNSLFQGIGSEPGMGRGSDQPADSLAGLTAASIAGRVLQKNLEAAFS
ncbi:hypothetical protein [Leisingera sp. F5]|nr:hypothetical protein [Leisingera sp. F5]